MPVSPFDHCDVERPELFQSFARIADQVEAIRHLHSEGRTHPGGLGIGARAITADHLGRSMREADGKTRLAERLNIGYGLVWILGLCTSDRIGTVGL